MIHFRVRYEGLRGRLGQTRRRTALLRSTSLAMVVPLLGLSAHVSGHLPFAPTVWFGGGAIVFVTAAVWQTRSSAEPELGRVLDRRHGLDELLVTAVEVDRRGAHTVVEGRLLDDAATAVATLGDEQALDGRTTRREGETVVALAMIVAGLWLLTGTIRKTEPVVRLPPLAPAGPGTGGRLPGVGGSASQGGARYSTSPAFGTLAGVLGDHGAAREMAAALARGDAAAAARSARALADRADALSPAGRADLAELMHEAADQIGSLDPELAQAVRRAARALENPELESVAAGVAELAAEIDAAGARSAGGSASADSSPHEHRGPPAARLAVEPGGEPLPAGQSERSAGTGAPSGDGAPGREESPAGFVRGGRAAEGSSAVGPDPLRYPWSLRETVRRYFAPEVRAP